MNFAQVAEQIKEFFFGLSGRQRLGLLTSALLTIGLVALFVHLMAKPVYATLYSNLEPAEAQTIGRQLAAQRISYDISTDGTTISIPANNVDKARAALAGEGLPHSGQAGYELFDKPDWGGSDFVEKVNYERALEGELERTIQNLDGVSSARVHLVLPKPALFVDRQQDAKAAVVVKLNGDPSPDLLYSIQHLVAGAVENLRPENVSVINADGEMPLEGGAPGGGAGTSRAETDLASKILATLAPVVGLGRVRADVTVQYNLASSEDTQETYDPKASAVLTYQHSAEGPGAVTGSNAAGVPGTPSNVPGSSATPSGVSLSSQLGGGNSAPASGQQTDSQTFAVSRSVHHSVMPAGSLQRLTAAVVVDDASVDNKGQITYRHRTPAEMQQIHDLAAAAIGLEPARGDSLVVENVSFFHAPTTPQGPKTLMQKIDTSVPFVPQLMHYGGFFLLALVIYIFFLRPVKDQVLEMIRAPKSAAEIALAGGSAPELPIGSAENDAVFSPTLHVDPIEQEAMLARELNATSSEVKRAVMLKKHLAEKVKREPVTAGRLVHNWVRSREDRR